MGRHQGTKPQQLKSYAGRPLADLFVRCVGFHGPSLSGAMVEKSGGSPGSFLIHVLIPQDKKFGKTCLARRLLALSTANTHKYYT